MRRLAATMLIAVPTLLASALIPPHPARTGTQAVTDFLHFESGHVHPIAMTPDGSRLLVVNTADARLSVFDLNGASPVRIAEIPVGLEPVSVALNGNQEAWVVNHLSDDVSVVDLTTLHTRATLKVGDEPSDVVFAGTPRRAWVSVSQEDAIKSYDPLDLTAAPVVVAIPGRKPRSLSVTPDGAKVDVAVFNGNHGATVLSEPEAGDSLPPPVPAMRAGLPPAPKVGLLANFGSGHWRDISGKLWDSKIKYTVPMVELVEISAATRTVTRVTADLATIMMGTAINPVTGACAVTGTYALLELRFEPNVRGHTTESRLAVVPTTGLRTLVSLNPHINYATTPGPAAERDSAISMPTGVAWSPDGQRLYVTGMGSDKLAVLDASGRLLARVPTVAGPTGVVVDGARQRLYVVGRIRSQLQTLSTADFHSVDTRPIGFDPTPDAIVNGRRLFYGGFTSGHGDQSCASCHLFGDKDLLAWDLGDPTGNMAPVPPGMLDPLLTPMHPMKGPMLTQSLRGLANTGVLHWRGDRSDFMAFKGATQSLLGLAAPIPDSEMVAMSQFVQPLVYPPNPNQNLDRTFRDAPPGSPSAERGRVFYTTTPVDAGRPCAFCHALPTGTNTQSIDRIALQAAQDMKVPQLRDLYEKSGFTDAPGAVNKRGFGYTHNGSVDNLFNFLQFPGFAFAAGAAGDAQRRDVEAYLLAFDTGMAPAVGAQVTFDGSAADAGQVARMDTLVSRADAGDCDLMAKGRIGSTPRGWKYVGAGSWHADRSGLADVTSAELRALASAGHEITVSGVPIGCGTRMGLDRDRDTYPDGDEVAAGSDPGNPASTPINLGVPPLASRTAFAGTFPNPFQTGTRFDFSLATSGEVDLVVYDVLGREIRGVARRAAFAAGAHSLTWDGRTGSGMPAGAGVYFARLRVGGQTFTRMLAKLAR